MNRTVALLRGELRAGYLIPASRCPGRNPVPAIPLGPGPSDWASKFVRRACSRTNASSAAVEDNIQDVPPSRGEFNEDTGATETESTELRYGDQDVSIDEHAGRRLQVSILKTANVLPRRATDSQRMFVRVNYACRHRSSGSTSCYPTRTMFLFPSPSSKRSLSRVSWRLACAP